MKKLLTFVFALLLILSLTACGKTKGNGESAAGGAVSNMPNAAASTTETEQAQLVNIKPASGTIAHIGTEETYELTVAEIEQIAAVIENGSWDTEGTADCVNDCKLVIHEKTYYYHSECGTFNDNANHQNLSISDAEKESINAVFSQYITLDPEHPM